MLKEMNIDRSMKKMILTNTSDAIPKHLGREDLEHGNGSVEFDVVKKI